MRIVAVADTHTFTDDLHVPDGDVFVHAGDLGRGGDLAELRLVAAWIRGLPHRYKVIVAGNHDWALAPCERESPVETERSQRNRRETFGGQTSATDADACRACRARELTTCDATSIDSARAIFDDWFYLQDARAIVGSAAGGGLAFYGSPWQPAYNDWAFNLPRGQPLATRWAAIPDALDVLVTHGPPAGIGDRSPVGGRSGCADLRARVTLAKPRLHLYGHIHQDGGVWHVGPTTFANVTTWECERPPTVIDIDPTSISVVDVPAHGRRDDDD